MKIPKQKTLNQLHNIFWKLFSEYVRLSAADEDGYVQCCSCGRMKHWTAMQAGHYINKTHLAIRYDPMNVNPQCRQCNAFKQGNSVGYREVLVKKYGERAIIELEARRNFPAGYTRDGLLLLIVEYK